jgi:hypothetical protein
VHEVDVELPVDPPWKAGTPCLLTGTPDAPLREVVVRRIIFLGVVWGQETATAVLPLAAPLRLAVLQYLRGLRPVVSVLVAFLLELQLAGPGAETGPRVLAATAGFLAVWLPVAAVLRLEPVRLRRVSPDRRWLTLRFSDAAAATRARQGLGS